MSDDASLFGGDFQQPGPARQGTSRWGRPEDALTEILPVEELGPKVNLEQPAEALPPGRAVPTKVYEDWRLSPSDEGYRSGDYVVEGYVPALMELDQLETRRKLVPAKRGWRGLVHNLTRISLAPGRDEMYETALRDRVQRMVRATFPITVIGVKGGVGKTVVTEVLGSTFSAARGDRVVAVDLDPDAGNLISRHGRESELSIADLIACGASSRYLEVRAHTSQNKATRLEVLCGPDFAQTPMPLRDQVVDALMPILNEHYSLVLMDTGTGLKTNLMTAVLRQSRALVVVTSASIDAMEETHVSLDWLRRNGYQNLLDTMVLVINNTQRGKPGVNVKLAVEQFSRQIGRDRIFVLPFDSHIFEGRQITHELLSPGSRRRYLELAAAISELFPQPPGWSRTDTLDK